jgi:hypothetical protein
VDHPRQGFQAGNEIVHGKRKETSHNQSRFESVQSRFANILVDLQFSLHNVQCVEIYEIREKLQVLVNFQYSENCNLSLENSYQVLMKTSQILKLKHKLLDNIKKLLGKARLARFPKKTSL